MAKVRNRRMQTRALARELSFYHQVEDVYPDILDPNRWREALACGTRPELLALMRRIFGMLAYTNDHAYAPHLRHAFDDVADGRLQELNEALGDVQKGDFLLCLN